MKQEKLIRKFDRQVMMYENNRQNPKLESWRKRVIRDASGNVLEVGVGAGANFPYYDKEKITGITGVDFSSEMIKSSVRAARRNQINAKFINQDITTLQIESDSYDTIVSTLTLCSYPEPIKTLNQFNNWCRKDGRVLLLEHGLSTNGFLSMTQRVVDPIYRKISGCHCNRNMLKLVEESQLIIDKVERFWSGIGIIIWARPSKLAII
ncbi:class I SAM-dependent methyltransferase [Paucisalibacillus globulus]|uniref:class I SAM-dependent methyltransferase n=1 Tax=Paucisalibacillus globulus TaxID=351095 RepID=UPI00041610E7|nr:class I SAM-dependent methyltransferase [Paucisalibacillus globulus]